MASKIEDYALLSNMRSGPLVSRYGSVDWWCVPRFDSPALFGALLGTPDHGRWLLAPYCAVDDDAAVDMSLPGVVAVERFYAENTFVLHTVWSTDTGTVRVTDFMPLNARTELIRRVEGLTGEVEMFQDIRLRFNYGSSVPWLSRFDVLEDESEDAEAESVLVGMAGPDSVVFHGDPLPEADPDKTKRRHAGSFTVAAGQTRDFTLTWFPSHGVPPEAVDVNETLTATVNLWQEWTERYEPLTDPAAMNHTDPDEQPPALHASGADAEDLDTSERLSARDVGRHGDRPHQEGTSLGGFRLTATDDEPEELIRRSLLVVRGLMHQATGGLIGAPTTSLPEVVGADRNWDHRLAWPRDAASALEVMLDHGHDREAAQLRNWLLRAVAGDVNNPSNIYTLDGSPQIRERLVDLPGYERSRPVRDGNSSGSHYQSDVAGHVLRVFEMLRRRGVQEDHLSWPLQQALLRAVVANYEEKDQGVWEMRGEPQYYTHSRVMMWAAMQAGVDAVRIHGLPGDVETWEEHRDQLAHEVWTSGYDPQAGSFVQYYGSTDVDASLLQLPMVGFVAYDDERMLGTVERIRRELTDRSGLLHRYRNLPQLTDLDDVEAFASSIGQDGFAGQSAPSVSATLQLAEQLALCGHTQEAVRLTDVALGTANELGLLPSTYSPTHRRATGNFPQVEAHLRLIRVLDILKAETAPDAS
ncbi:MULTISPECIES: glycoside hydrolase family 15 protein [Kocuria]|uniref:glycoside hydrolase family 15 protein n=1 Tax=Kocuria TaxID=57493 RepID=UPI0021A2B7C7|nr:MULTISPECIES: glycoside hydrolase family 15 protein [Kocuria]MCT1544493.1 glycoside hydrolase family 15 protein [Kocuria rhizophila]MCT2170514.1 glycoside hydrolase family 15 protein [Kocuria rhizophila]MDN3462459.1 glycoside hydrolase family 15 protein [Kocuria sp. APC 4018]